MRSAFVAATMMSVLLNASALAQAGEDRVLKPKINGVELEIDCKRDFPNGKPTMAFLKRMENTLFHPDGNGITSFLLAGEIERQELLKNTNSFARFFFQGAARKYTDAANKKEFVIDTLTARHPVTKVVLKGAPIRCEND